MDVFQWGLWIFGTAWVLVIAIVVVMVVKRD